MVYWNKMKRYKPVPVTVFLLFFLASVPADNAAPGLLTDEKRQEIEQFIVDNMRRAKIPGAAVAIVNGAETVYSKGFGFADIQKKIPVSPDTLFELGSTSKAFTGLGVLSLMEKGLLSPEDSVTEYLPWFEASYRDEPVDLKIKHFLYHTSGIPYETIGDIAVADGSTALEETVRALSGVDLAHAPGRQYLYATVNYDVLGLVMEKITGMPYEKVMQKTVLEPLGLRDTFVHRKKAYNDSKMSTGYKLGFLRPRAYSAPEYRGNTPAGYVISNLRDIARWLKIQYHGIGIPAVRRELITASHLPDRSVPPSGSGSSYAVGWEYYQKSDGEISHGGSNPNFSTFFVFKPGEKTGVAVLANLNTAYTDLIGQGIMNILYGEKTGILSSDLYHDLDNAGFALFVIASIFSIITLVFIFLMIKDFIRKERKLVFKPGLFRGMLFLMLFTALIAYCLYLIPNVLFDALPWSFIEVWSPFSFIPALVVLLITVILFGIYFQICFYFPKRNDKPFFPLIVLSFVSGFGNAFIIFTVNEALNKIRNIGPGLVLYFLMGIVLYVSGQRLIRKRMIKLTNDLIFEKRIELTEKILNTPYYKIENIQQGKINACLNNDTERISHAPNVIIGGLTALVTLICCFIYLGIVNFYGLLISVVIIALSGSLYFFMGESANKLWEKIRDIQNVFFGFINDLIGGFKELSLNRAKRGDFIKDMETSCVEYRDKSARASLKFVNVFVIGELLFTAVIGTVAFLFPYIFPSIQVVTLRTYILVFLYMTGPISGVMETIPQLWQIRVSWKRIKEFLKEMDAMTIDKVISMPLAGAGGNGISLKLEDVVYEYHGNDKSFKVGPITYEFHGGEIIFITGGNGSGKTTLAKLMTGLYKPQSGVIRVNGEAVDFSVLGELYASVFSDYHLFRKFYGIEYAGKEKLIREKLALLRLEEKLEITDGVFSTINLSTGQRKRIALLVSYAEDKEIFLFDEWAADQDPEFRKYFYHVLIQELKAAGKCVIAITHDDHYFHVADRVLKMDMGRMDD